MSVSASRGVPPLIAVAVVATVVAVCLAAAGVKSVRRVRVSAVPVDLLLDVRCCTLWAPAVNAVGLVGTLLALVFIAKFLKVAVGVVFPVIIR